MIDEVTKKRKVQKEGEENEVDESEETKKLRKLSRRGRRRRERIIKGKAKKDVSCISSSPFNLKRRRRRAIFNAVIPRRAIKEK